jgi:hypothetical protein
VTSSPAGTDRSVTGVLGQPTTSILFGNSRTSEDDRSGGRFTAGMWLNKCQTIGIEGSFFFLEPGSTNFTASSAGDPNLDRPFFNASLGAPDAELVGFPGVLTGTVRVAESSSFGGAEAYARLNVCCSCRGRLDAILGYRYLRLRDRLSIDEDLTATDPINAGTRLQVHDGFETENQFHGGEVGVIGEYRCGCFFFEGRAKVALGSNQERADIDGNTVVTVPGFAPVNRTGGLLALPTNIGHHSRADFAVIPEVGANVGLQLWDRVRGFVGYSFLYWHKVARPGGQIDLGANPTQIPPGTLVGPARPALPFNQTDYWAQGMNCGVELRY